ncbi:MAG: pantetheine-phosphate adenylyltransferase [Oscillospiraceae bacterium]|jgi:pantetheine-phosphate adenylyltransferase|nr:pantetheine-phosphate adenylyltransferase [Oscillospiraceae bacterium]
MKTAIYPGSFDPVTFGHIDIIRRAVKLFDKVIVVVSVNPTKPADFSIEERLDFLKRCTKKIKNIEIDSNSGLFIDYFKKKNADVIVKGIRAMSDFEYEFQMALINKDLYHPAETVFLSADAASMFLSSSAVKQIAMFGGDISAFVPECILKDILERMKIK